MASIAVLGAGISGLTATYFLAQQAKQAAGLISKIYLFEQTPRCGGWISSTRFEDGAVYEHGPHTIRAGNNASKTVLSLIDELGLSSEVLPVRNKDPGNSKRMICVNDQLYPLATSVPELMKKMPPFTQRLVTPIWKERSIPKGSGQDESVDSFFRRRFGSEIADYFVASLCCGIYAADSKILGMKACFPKVLDAEQRHGNVVSGFMNLFTASAPEVDPDADMSNTFDKDTYRKAQMQSQAWAGYTLRDGLEALPERMAELLHANPLVQVCYNTAIQSITLQCDSAHETTAHVQTDAGQSVQFDQVFCTLPDHVVGRLLTGNGIGVDKLQSLVGQLPFVDVSVVNLEYPGDVPKARGFGYLIPPKEKSPLLGVIFDSCVTPALDAKTTPPSTRLTAMMGGSWFDERLGSDVDEAKLFQMATSTISKHLKVNNEPIREKVRILRQCIPTYVVGHADRVRKMRSVTKENDLPVWFTGASYDGVAVTDIVHNTIKSCKRLVRKLEQQAINVERASK